MKRGDIMTVLILSSCADNSMSQRDMNLKVVNTFGIIFLLKTIK